MKVCLTEAIKTVKEYEEQKELLIRQEDECSKAMYKEGEDKITNGYDYETIREDIRDLDTKIRKIKVMLAKANQEVLVEGFDVSICEALIMLAQLQAEKGQINSIASSKQIDRRITANGVIEFTECLYDVNKAKADVQQLRRTITQLQMAIDRANLTNYIEI